MNLIDLIDTDKLEERKKMKRIATLKITNFEDVKLLMQALTDNDYSVLVQFDDLVDKRLRFNNKANEYLVHIIERR